uniref:Uncharacterized protein n=1 Tax=Peronospora matthiolae TaxID=2874970 RepID=A0AAV1UGB1_9STRA
MQSQKVMSTSRDAEYASAVQRAAAASMARRRNTQEIAQTPPAGLSDNSGEDMRPDLALVMEQRVAMVARLEELERERLTLPAPTGTTFGPGTTETRALVPTTRAAKVFRSPSMRMTHVRPMEVDDLHDVFGTESRVRNASVRTERRVLRKEQQQHFQQLASAREGLRVAAEAQGMQLRAVEEAQETHKADHELLSKLRTDNYSRLNGTC